MNSPQIKLILSVESRNDIALIPFTEHIMVHYLMAVREDFALIPRLVHSNKAPLKSMQYMSGCKTITLKNPSSNTHTSIWTRIQILTALDLQKQGKKSITK
jgi:hypothetical protein